MLEQLDPQLSCPERLLAHRACGLFDFVRLPAEHPGALGPGWHKREDLRCVRQLLLEPCV
eukprot:2588025-Prorocentrum_lima.AAC.1